MKLQAGTAITIVGLFAGMAFGQATNSADITGTVTAASGAVIPGVTVAVKDLDKNLEHTYATNDSGAYDTGPLFPEDHYMIVFSKQGFATYQRGPMILNIGIIGMNAQLGVGQMTQQVIVNDAAPLLETTTPELSSTLPAETLQELPQVGAPDWQEFLVLLPGTAGTHKTETTRPIPAWEESRPTAACHSRRPSSTLQ